jgi:hypothetical protein
MNLRRLTQLTLFLKHGDDHGSMDQGGLIDVTR